MGATVCQLDDNFVQKSGERVKPCEAAAMRLVGEGANVPLPEYIDENYDHENGYMLMTYIPGSTLEVLWGKLNDDTKGRLCRDTWDIIAQIRKIHRPPEYQHFFQCSADGSATHDPLIEDLKKPPRPILNDTVLRERIYERYLYYGGQRYANELSDMLPHSSSSVFTHADIAPRNIMVDDCYHITGIIDWERAGWYPHYWEYANIMGPACRCGDWQVWMDRTAPQQFKCNLEGIIAARRVLF